MLKIRPPIIHPLLFGIYPVIALIARNISEIPALEGVRSLIVSFLITFLILLAFSLALKNAHKAGLITSLIMLSFFSYGHLNLVLRNISLLGDLLGRHRFLVPLYVGIFGVALWGILRTRRDLSSLTRFLNVVASVLIIIPLFQIAAFEIQDFTAQRSQAASAAGDLRLPEDRKPPDVYYILMDGYPRGDFIAQHLGYDNAPFLDALEEKGFFVARCSQANYSDTRFSMASALNMIYLDDGTGLSEVVFRRTDLNQMIRSSTVQQNFASLGYTIVTFDPGYRWLRWDNTDIQYTPGGIQTSRNLQAMGLNEFERLLLHTSAGKLLLDMQVISTANQVNRIIQVLDNPRALHRENVLFILEAIPKTMAEVPGPKFVYAHVVSPHPPFVFTADGTPLDNSPTDELLAYGDQIAYVNTRLLEIVDRLIAESDVPPIIIIQGDHGATIDYAGLRIDEAERLGILNAYYLPGGPEPELSASLSPVNTFRLIFDRYFNGHYGLLKDKSILGRQSHYIQLDCAAGQ
ncbi:MAG TPA: sulfatase-like hydrolase/transferase [Anaerolineales bacterium]|nr:sulfatase-like hydrolase/transferase [Anaerolineales bacterium]